MHSTICTLCLSCFPHLPASRHLFLRQHIYYATSSRQSLPHCCVSLGSLLEISMTWIGFSGSVCRPISLMLLALDADVLLLARPRSSDHVWSLQVRRNGLDRRMASESYGLNFKQTWLEESLFIYSKSFAGIALCDLGPLWYAGNVKTKPPTPTTLAALPHSEL